MARGPCADAIGISPGAPGGTKGAPPSETMAPPIGRPDDPSTTRPTIRPVGGGDGEGCDCGACEVAAMHRVQRTAPAAVMKALPDTPGSYANQPFRPLTV